MLRQIPVSDVVIGMYIHELCGSWMDHPFWKSGFVLKSREDLQRLRQSSVTQVWIDISKGLSTDKGISSEQADRIAVEVLDEAVEQGRQQKVSMAKELIRARKVLHKSRGAVIDMFTEARMGHAINVELAADTVREMTLSVGRHPQAMISLVRLKQADEYTYMHSVAVAGLMLALARQLGLDEEQIQDAGLAGLLHDLGKAAIPDAILNKPGSLSDNEFAKIRLHPEFGAQMLKGALSVERPEVYDACLHHHEKIDGSGYPHGLKQAEIGLLARMATICDVYDAVTSDRPYKKGWDPADAIHRMAQWRGHFDQKIFQVFVRTVGIYPVGSLVRLSSGRLAVVMEQSEDSLLTPRVKVFFSSKSGVPVEQEVLQLAAGGREKIVARESAEQWGFRDLEQLWAN